MAMIALSPITSWTHLHFEPHAGQRRLEEGHHVCALALRRGKALRARDTSMRALDDILCVSYRVDGMLQEFKALCTDVEPAADVAEPAADESADESDDESESDVESGDEIVDVDVD